MSNKYLFKPFLGRLIVRSIKESVEDFLKEEWGVSKDSKIQIVTEEYKSKYRVPVTAGQIVSVSKNAFGEAFSRRYGKDIAEEGKTLKPGDLVYFIYNQAFNVDPKSEYLELNDEQILGYDYLENIEEEKLKALGLVRNESIS